MNKKGNVLMISILFIIIIFVFAIINMVTFQAWDDIDDFILEDLDHNESKQVITDVSTRGPSIFDSLILIVFAGIWVMGIASGIMKDEHPLLFGFMMLMIVAVLIAGAFIANSFEDFFQDETISGMALSFPKTYWILTNLFMLGVLMALSSLLAVMAKNRL